MLLLGATAAFAQKPPDKPRVPPGVDPGGVAVAIIGNGIDYTRPEISARLARDGEGEIIGWDFIDNDRRPYNDCASTDQVRCAGLWLRPDSGIFQSPAQKPKMVVMRASAQKPQSLVQAVQAIVQTQTRIVLFEIDPPAPEEFVREAARRYPDLILFAPSPVKSRDAPSELGDNYFIWASSDQEGLGPVNGLGYLAHIAAGARKCLEEAAAAKSKAILECSSNFMFPKKPE